MTAARTDTPMVDSPEMKLLRTLKDEARQLGALAYRMQADRIDATANIQNQKAISEFYAQLHFAQHCNLLIDDFDHRLKNVKIKPNLFQSPISKEFLIKDMNFMLATMQLTKDLIANPENDNSRQKLAEHAVKIEAHLKDERMLTKSRKIWGGVIFALGIVLLCVAPFLPIFLISGLALAVTAGTVASGVPVFAFALAAMGLGGTLFSFDPAQDQLSLCSQAQKFRGVRK